MLIRTLPLPAPTESLAQAAILALRVARIGTAGLGFETRCVRCRGRCRLPKPVLPGWQCARCLRAHRNA